MKLNKIHLFPIILLVDLIIIFFTTKICHGILVADYIKAFILQAMIILITLNDNLTNIILKLFNTTKNKLSFFLILAGLISFYILFSGTLGGYVFGGQRYCNISDIPQNFKRFL